jgi:hypothetical protein
MPASLFDQETQMPAQFDVDGIARFRKLNAGRKTECISIFRAAWIAAFVLAVLASATIAQETTPEPATPALTENPEPDAQPPADDLAADQTRTPAASKEGWSQLLDEKLSRWEVFTGVPHRSVKIEGFPPSESADCRTGKPFGIGDPKNVYSVKMVDGKPVLHVTGELYAALTSVEEFENYHFSTEFKWGDKKWPPREHVKRDSGILIHCTGKHGAFWNVWMRCLQCQIQEGDCGDFIQLAGTSCQVRTTPETAGKETPTHSTNGKWSIIGRGAGKWGVKRIENHEIEGDWNRIEVFAVGDKAVFQVNGHPVMHLRNTRTGKYFHENKLTKGKIQIQSEAAEIWYRDMEIRSVEKLPARLAGHFNDEGS